MMMTKGVFQRLAVTCLLLSVTLTVTLALTATELAALQASGHVTATVSGSYYVVTSDGIPDHATPAISGNPNSATAQSHSYQIPINPTDASEVSCLPMGPIAITLNGVPFFSPVTMEGENAVEGEYKETFDSCDGHSAQGGVYHYHQDPGCITASTQAESFVGIAFDGYPIYSQHKADGTVYMTSELDECHGSEDSGTYRYILTEDYPYVLGCYRGEVTDSSVLRMQEMPGCAIAGAARSWAGVPLLVFLALSSLYIQRQ